MILVVAIISAMLLPHKFLINSIQDTGFSSFEDIKINFDDLYMYNTGGNYYYVFIVSQLHFSVANNLVWKYKEK